MTLLLTLTMGIGPYVLYLFSALAPLITSDLGISRTQLGSLVTVAFGLASAATVSSGSLSDRLGSRRSLLVLFGLTGVALLATALGATYAWLLVATAIAGLAQASSNPITNRLVAETLRPGNRGLVMGIKQSGVQAAQVLAGTALPSLALLVGWRGAAAASLVLVLAGLSATLRLVTRSPLPPGRSHGRTTRPPIRPLIRWLALYGFLIGIVVQGTNVYLPLYSFEVLDFSPRLAGITAGVTGAAGVVARIVWGKVAERLETAIAPMFFLAVASVLASLTLIASRAWPPLVWVGVVIFAGSALASTVVLMVAVLRGVPVHQAGRASGYVMLVLYGGFTVGPVGFGFLVDITGAYTVSLVVLTMCGVAAAALCAVWWSIERPTSGRPPPARNGRPSPERRDRRGH